MYNMFSYSEYIHNYGGQKSSTCSTEQNHANKNTLISVAANHTMQQKMEKCYKYSQHCRNTLQIGLSAFDYTVLICNLCLSFFSVLLFACFFFVCLSCNNCANIILPLFQHIKTIKVISFSENLKKVCFSVSSPAYLINILFNKCGTALCLLLINCFISPFQVILGKTIC